MEAGALHTTAGSAATEYLGADEARQEVISSKETVTYKRVLAGNENKFNGDLKTMVNGMHAEVLSEGMKVYTEKEPPAVIISMEDRVDSQEAVLTIGVPKDGQSGSEGTIRNEVHRDVAYMDVTADFISGNAYDPDYDGDKDVRDLQGFYLNRMPTKEELAYNQTSIDGERNMTCLLYTSAPDQDSPGRIPGISRPESRTRCPGYRNPGLCPPSGLPPVSHRCTRPSCRRFREGSRRRRSPWPGTHSSLAQ